MGRYRMGTRRLVDADAWAFGEVVEQNYGDVGFQGDSVPRAEQIAGLVRNLALG
jgi:hypothetical protein